MEIKSCSKGEIATLKVQLEASQRNIIVSKPTTEVRYDLILDDHKEKLRTQVKYLNRFRNNSENELGLILKSNPHNSKRPYTKQQIDLMLIYCPSIDKIIALYPKDFHNKNYINININNPKSKYYYEKFLW